MSESEWIDKFLWDIRKGNYIFLGEESPDVQHVALEKALAYGLLVRDRNNFELTEKGHQLIEAGGFDKWKKAKEKREDEAHRATVSSSESSRSSARASWTSAAFAAIAILFSVYQFIDSQEKQNEINELKSQLKSLSQQVQVQRANRIESRLREDSSPIPKKKNK